MKMDKIWQFAGSSTEGDGFEIKGVDIWGHAWQTKTGEEAHVSDPVYGKRYVFKVYSIQDNDQSVEFAAGEFSKGEWGFYTRE